MLLSASPQFSLDQNHLFILSWLVMVVKNRYQMLKMHTEQISNAENAYRVRNNLKKKRSEIITFVLL